VWDLGANVGVFSRLACAQGAQTLAFDLDPAAVEQNYLACKAEKLENLLPLILDLTNPSPGLGWQNHERRALSERGPADLIMALALVHHLAISNNVPLSEIAAFFASLGEWLIIEFVPKEDSQVQKLLASRLDIFKDYHIQGFEAAFSGFYELIEKTPLPESLRTLYLMRRIPV
jgi:ribosomal protein L11 methylase PrmA